MMSALTFRKLIIVTTIAAVVSLFGGLAIRHWVSQTRTATETVLAEDGNLVMECEFENIIIENI